MPKLLWLLCLTRVLLAAQSPDVAIRRVLQDQVEAWNRGDIAGFMRGYEDSDRTLFVGSDVTRGYSNVLERYRRRYVNAESMGTLTFSDLEVQPLGDRYASVLGRFHLKRGASGGGDSSGVFTLLFRKTGAGWKIILDHTSS